MDSIVWFVIGAVVASACWWVYVRHLGGVISDLKDIATTAKAAAAKAQARL